MPQVLFLFKRFLPHDSPTSNPLHSYMSMLKPILRNFMKTLQAQLDGERRLVSFDNYDLSVRELMAMFSEGNLYIPPEYQRQFIWDDDRQSMLVESIFLGIPIPNIFFATNPDASWEVVDGVQRLCSLFRFIGDKKVLEIIDRESPLKIRGLEKLNLLNGKQFDEIDKTLQLSFQTRPVRITVLNDKSDENVRFDLFERLNTGGVSLTHQEIRNCIFRGKFNEDLKKLSGDANFNKIVKLKESEQSNGTKEEYVLRFFSYYEKYSEFDHSVKDFLNDYMSENSKKNISPKLKKLFSKTFTFLKEELPHGVCRGGRRLTPANLYEAVAVGTALALAEGSNIKRGILNDLQNSNELNKLTTGATNSRARVKGRIEFVKDALLS